MLVPESLPRNVYPPPETIKLSFEELNVPFRVIVAPPLIVIVPETESIVAVFSNAVDPGIVTIIVIEPVSETPANVPAYVFVVLPPPPGGLVGLSSFLQLESSKRPARSARVNLSVLIVSFRSVCLRCGVCPIIKNHSLRFSAEQDEFLRTDVVTGMNLIEIYSARKAGRIIQDDVNSRGLFFVNQLCYGLPQHVMEQQHHTRCCGKGIPDSRGWVEWIRVVLQELE